MSNGLSTKVAFVYVKQAQNRNLINKTRRGTFVQCEIYLSSFTKIRSPGSEHYLTGRVWIHFESVLTFSP